jgi:hypothetical protein
MAARLREGEAKMKEERAVWTGDSEREEAGRKVQRPVVPGGVGAGCGVRSDAVAVPLVAHHQPLAPDVSTMVEI